MNDVVHHLLRERDRNRETIAGVEAGVARDRAVDSDHLTANVDQWSARIAGIDGGVRLDVVLDRVTGIQKRAERAAPGADDASGNGEVQA